MLSGSDEEVDEEVERDLEETVYWGDKGMQVGSQRKGRATPVTPALKQQGKCMVGTGWYRLVLLLWWCNLGTSINVEGRMQ